MNCDQARRHLTAYLDGELEGDRGSAIRGHLRGCADCRKIASDEAALRDGLRALPPIDPPSSLWAGVQAKLAAAEMADADKPAWRRALSRWLPQLPKVGLAGVALAGATGLLVLRATHHREPPPAIAAPAHVPQATVPAPIPSTPSMSPTQDVSDELAASAAEVTQSYAAAAAELVQRAEKQRPQWSTDQKQLFDARVAELRAKVDAADDGQPRQAAYRALIRYLERAVVREVPVG